MATTQANGPTVLTLICESCGTLFRPDDAHDIAIMGPGYARYGCPECGWVVRSIPPATAERPSENDVTPAIVPIGETGPLPSDTRR
jgi:predicted RNA-binding Zn-ribbon protein involved in translation (DUF1610 family)